MASHLRKVGTNKLKPRQQLTRAITGLMRTVGPAKTPSPNPSAARGPLKQTSQARKFIAQTGKAATAAKASSAIKASAQGGTSTDRLTARRTTNPNAANLSLGKGQTTAKLSTGGAGKPPAPTPAGVESTFKKGGQRATSRGQGTKGLNVGGFRRPGGTVGVRGTRELRAPLGTFRGLR